MHGPLNVNTKLFLSNFNNLLAVVYSCEHKHSDDWLQLVTRMRNPFSGSK